MSTTLHGTFSAFSGRGFADEVIAISIPACKKSTDGR
jgi:hypothetical protein